MQKRKYTHLKAVEGLILSIHHAGRNTIYNYWAGDGEHLCTDAEDEAFCLCQLRTQYFSVITRFFRTFLLFLKRIGMPVGKV